MALLEFVQCTKLRNETNEELRELNKCYQYIKDTMEDERQEF